MIQKARKGNCSRKRKQTVRKTATESTNILVIILNCFQKSRSVDTLITGPIAKDVVTETQQLSWPH
jgi:hypothetical protein